MNPKPDIIIGIDPDVEASGFAVLYVNERKFGTIERKPFGWIIRELRYYGTFDNKRIAVVIESSHLLKTNWHLPPYCSANKAASMGEDVGRCHEVGVLLIEMARAYGLEVIEQQPLRLCWGKDKNGKQKKISQEQIAYFVPEWPNRSNQEERDAALLAWAAANLPIKVRV